ncbi:hypothetical protein GCM10022297_16590 [Lactobacillus hamsteri]|uniref:Uncharacterized protein n=1 Tax=Lactobacillus hamsteri DSM 5661 = JCM 6256 TaxID=1423754 RepID=A0A0R1YLJ8_9LACO|nr:hypothetical protein [Lactobacillus hamsteri]KRM40827.1 hypothetical protein FC39_GL000023 [Lactobacillus hamsteri DSM 5661 = JCM 6256]
MNERKQNKGIWLAISIIIILLIAFFALAYMNHQKEDRIMKPSNKIEKVTKKDELAGLSIRQAVGLSIVYAHLRYSDNPNWNNIYQQAENGNLTIQKYDKYTFSDSNKTVEPQGTQSLYVLNDAGALIVTDADNLKKSSFVFGDSNEQLGHVDVHTAYRYVKSEGKVNEWNKVSSKITVENQVKEQEKPSTNDEKQADAASSSDNSDEKKNDGENDNQGLQTVQISPRLQGTWYAAGLFAEKLGNTFKITNNSVDGKTIYKLTNKPETGKELKAFGKKYYGKYFALENDSKGFSILPAQSLEIDANSYSLKHIDGIECLVNVSTAIAGVYFKNPQVAKQISEKYAGDDDETKLMGKIDE